MTVVPYWKKYVVSAPFGLTVAFSTTVVGAMLAAAPVVTTGFSAADATAGAHSAQTSAAAPSAPRVRMVRMPLLA
jgi:hypothetical protein